MRRGVLLLVGGEQEIELVRAIDAPGSGLTVTRRCADTAELLAAVAAGLAQAAVIDAEAHGVDMTLVARTEEAGIRTVVLTSEGHQEWHRASARVAADAAPARVVQALLGALAAPAVVTAGGTGGIGGTESPVGTRDGGEAAGADRGEEHRTGGPEDSATDDGEHADRAAHADRGASPAGAAGAGGGSRTPGDGSGRDSGAGRGGGGEEPPEDVPGEGDGDGSSDDEDALGAWLERGEDPGRAVADLLMPDEGAEVGSDAAPGRIVAVWGTPGAPGRSTIAANLAVELAALAGGEGRRRRRGPVEERGDGRPVLLVDADTEAPSLAQMLGMLEDASSMAAVARRAAHGRLTPGGLLRQSPALRAGLHVTTGLSRADRWREVPVTALQEILRTARRAAQLTVLDLGAGAEEPPPGLDAWGAPPRHGVTRSALAEADVVLVVGSADPIGVRRLVDALVQLQEDALAPAGRIVPVVTKVRASAAGPDPAQAVLAALDRFANVSEAIVIPDDRAAFDECLLRGSVLAEAAPKSAARNPLMGLAQWLLPAAGASVAA